MKEKLHSILNKHLLKIEIFGWLVSIISFKYSVETFAILLTTLALIYFLWGITSGKEFNSETIQTKILGISAAASAIGFMFYYLGLPGAEQQLSAGMIGLIMATLLSWVNIYHENYKIVSVEVIRPHILLAIVGSHGIMEGYLV